MSNLSLTTLDEKLALDMEPRTSKPSIRLRAIEALSAAGIPVRVMLAPLIPGLNDTEIPAILEAARNAGARAAAFQMIRLPLTVAPVFQDWLHRTQPARADRVLAQIRHMRSKNSTPPSSARGCAASASAPSASPTSSPSSHAGSASTRHYPPTTSSGSAPPAANNRNSSSESLKNTPA